MTNGIQGLEGPVCGASDPPEEVTSSFVPGWGMLPGLDAAVLSEHKPQIVMKSGNLSVGCNEGITGNGFSLAERQIVTPELPSKTSEANSSGCRELDPT